MNKKVKKACWLNAIKAQDIGGATVRKLASVEFGEDNHVQMDDLNSIIYECISDAENMDDMENKFDYHIDMLVKAKKAAMNITVSAK